MDCGSSIADCRLWIVDWIADCRSTATVASPAIRGRASIAQQCGGLGSSRFLHEPADGHRYVGATSPTVLQPLASRSPRIVRTLSVPFPLRAVVAARSAAARRQNASRFAATDALNVDRTSSSSDTPRFDARVLSARAMYSSSRRTFKSAMDLTYSPDAKWVKYSHRRLPIAGPPTCRPQPGESRAYDRGCHHLYICCARKGEQPCHPAHAAVFVVCPGTPAGPAGFTRRSSATAGRSGPTAITICASSAIAPSRIGCG